MNEDKIKKMKTLVIVESPSKGVTIQKYLGENYIVHASGGHVVDLAKGGNKGIGVDVNNNFKPYYTIMDGKLNTLDRLINAAEHCDNILLATDPDREGEAIAFHLKHRLESAGKPISRIEFHEITKGGVADGIKNQRSINMDLFKAQEARRVLDRIVGFMVSPFLINFFGPNLSAGRVQSVAVRLIADRENEIKTFVPEEYWNIAAKLKNSKNENFIAKYEGKVKSKQEADLVKSEIELPNMNDSQFTVTSVTSKQKKEKPQPPLITSKIQQVMAKKYNFEPERTMKAAQSLYELGYCTYIRTDSFRASDDAIKAVRKWISTNNFDVPTKSAEYKAKKSAQDAHECIRPTNINNLPDQIMATDDEKIVYKVIWQYFVASQMAPAIWDTLEVKLEHSFHKKHKFKATGKSLAYKGYLEIFNFNDDSKIEIPNLAKGDVLKFVDNKSMNIEQKFTQPPARYTDASLVSKLEAEEIGRPSTYAETLKKVTSRNYVEKSGNSYKATDLGIKVTDILTKYFPFMNYEYTANMEKQLDDIADGKLDHLMMLKSFFDPFRINLNQAYKVNGGDVCEKCNSPMLSRTNSKDNTKFLACSGYPKCRNTKSVKT